MPPVGVGMAPRSIPESARPARTILLIAKTNREPRCCLYLGGPGKFACPSRRRGAGTGSGREPAGGPSRRDGYARPP